MQASPLLFCLFFVYNTGCHHFIQQLAFLMSFWDKYPFAKLLLVESWLFVALSWRLDSYNTAAVALILCAVALTCLQTVIFEILLTAICPLLFFYNFHFQIPAWPTLVYFGALIVLIKNITLRPAPAPKIKTKPLPKVTSSPQRQSMPEASYTSTMAGVLNLRNPTFTVPTQAAPSAPASWFNDAAENVATDHFAFLAKIQLGLSQKLVLLAIGFTLGYFWIHPFWLAKANSTDTYHSYLRTIYPPTQLIVTAGSDPITLKTQPSNNYFLAPPAISKALFWKFPVPPSQ